jgi:hypothetical protein
MKLIFIAGKYRNKNGEHHVAENIRIAGEAALFVWQQGAAALCPHKNSSFFGGAEGTDDQLWMEGYIEMLKRCDAVWAIAGWQESEGARNEVKTAQEIGLPVLFTQSDVRRFLTDAGSLLQPGG